MYGAIIFILIIIVVFEFIGRQFDILAAGLFSNIFGILAVIFTAIAGFYFYISTLSYNDFLIKDKIMKAFQQFFSSDNGGGSKPSGDIIKATNSIDLGEVTLQGLVAELQSTLTSPKPLIFKGWGNRRLELDIERVRLMNDYINAVIDTGQSFIRLRADALISYEKIQLLAETELNQLKARARRSVLDLLLLEEKYLFELTELRARTERLELELQEYRNNIRFQGERHSMELLERRYFIKNSRDSHTLEYMIKEAEVYVLKLKAVSDVSIRDKVSELFDKIIRELNIGSITPTQALILTSLFGKGGSFQDFESEKKILDQMVEKYKQETEIKRQEAKEKFLDNEHKIFKLELDKRNFEQE